MVSIRVIIEQNAITMYYSFDFNKAVIISSARNGLEKVSQSIIFRNDNVSQDFKWHCYLKTWLLGWCVLLRPTAVPKAVMAFCFNNDQHLHASHLRGLYNNFLSGFPMLLENLEEWQQDFQLWKIYMKFCNFIKNPENCTKYQGQAQTVCKSTIWKKLE